MAIVVHDFAASNHRFVPRLPISIKVFNQAFTGNKLLLFFTVVVQLLDSAEGICFGKVLRSPQVLCIVNQTSSIDVTKNANISQIIFSSKMQVLFSSKDDDVVYVLIPEAGDDAYHQESGHADNGDVSVYINCKEMANKLPNETTGQC